VGEELILGLLRSNSDTQSGFLAGFQGERLQVLFDRLLAEAGSGKDRMLSATIYLPDMNDFAAMNAVWEAWIVPGQAPARATVQAKLAATGYKIEIQVIAAQ